MRVRCAVGVPWTAGIALCVAGCGATAPAPEPRQTVVHVDPAQTMAEVAEAAVAATGGGRDCLLVWGDVATRPPSAAPVRLVWAEFEHLDGWVVCGADAEPVLLDPRAPQMAMLYYRDDELYVGPVAEGGVTRLRDTVLAIRSDAPAPSLTVFDPDSSDRDVPAYRVLRRLREAPREFLLVAWPVGTRRAAK